MSTRGIAILGMHRSGTSFLAGSLQAAGCHLGECTTRNPYNAKGSRENRAFVRLNQDILEANGGGWFNPPANVVWSAAHHDHGVSLVADMVGAVESGMTWGFKDPRTLLTLAGWQQLLPGLRYVGIFRHPAAVVASLRQRHPKMPATLASFIWYGYNRRLLDAHDAKSFPLLCFDWDSKRLLARLNEMLCEVGLSTLDADEHFFTATLRHQSALSNDASYAIPDDCLALYQRLLEAARNKKYSNKRGRYP